MIIMYLKVLSMSNETSDIHLNISCQYLPFLKNSELECWAFTSCKEELGIQMNTTQPSPTVSPTLAVVYVPGYGGAQVPVFGGVNYTLMQPTSSPAPTGSGRPSVVPSLPPTVAAREKNGDLLLWKRLG